MHKVVYDSPELAAANHRYLELVLPSGCCCAVVRTRVRWAPQTGPPPMWLRLCHRVIDAHSPRA